MSTNRSVVFLGAAAAALVSSAAMAIGYTGDAKEVSRSAGPSGGVIVLWPRIVPAIDPTKDKNYDELHNLAAQLEQKEAAVVRKVLPDRAVDIRGEPERVCPREKGCRAVAVTLVLAHQSEGCATALVVSTPGTSPAHLSPWTGVSKLLADQVKFRDPPEAAFQVLDFLPCSATLQETDQKLDGVTALLKQAAASH